MADDLLNDQEREADPITQRSRRTMRLINVLIVLVVLWLIGRALSPKLAQVSEKISAILLTIALVVLWAVHAYGIRKTRREDVERVRFLTTHDGLTKLHNFRYLSQRLDQEIERSKRYVHPFCVLYVKLDRLDEAISEFGEKAGNRVLVAAAEAMRETCRITDTLGRALGRVGRDAFLVMMPETDAGGGLSLAQRIIAAIVSLRVPLPDGREIDFIGASIGAAAFPRDGQSTKAVLDRARAAADRARRAGGNCFVDSSHNRPSSRKT